MTTLVGTQSSFVDALKDLLELEYDATEAYEASLNRLDDLSFKSKLEEFRGDHKRHIQDLTELLTKHNAEPPTGPSGKQWVTKGKVVLANLVGDTTILAAMSSNETDTITAYERMCQHEQLWEDSKDILKRGLEDEKRHKAWMDSVR